MRLRRHKVFCNQNILSRRMKEREEELCLIEKKTGNKITWFNAKIDPNDCRETNQRKEGWNLDFIQQYWYPDQWI